ncbi:leucine rich repeat-containing protein [Besnoitia besnoiti]|uniref:Leucine rich repeat-containing protein n=1 Tax=Besnoitia besnoiti TaxID=94643 RepID=A0A2A9MIT9_BESBE|nr:leucine rich repeat-containing protein [Besnoitia besnoiti]PFH37829.1 leucine rich repeat-containing protein [Besnoitia besnoiti]
MVNSRRREKETLVCTVSSREEMEGEGSWDQSAAERIDALRGQPHDEEGYSPASCPHLHLSPQTVCGGETRSTSPFSSEGRFSSLCGATIEGGDEQEAGARKRQKTDAGGACILRKRKGFSEVPQEVLELIFSCVGVADLARCLCVAKSWHPALNATLSKTVRSLGTSRRLLPTDAQLEALLKRCPSVEIAELDCFLLTPKGAKLLRSLPSLKTLALTSLDHQTDEFFYALAEVLTELESFSIALFERSKSITNEALEHLASKLCKLRSFSVEFSFRENLDFFVLALTKASRQTLRHVALHDVSQECLIELTGAVGKNLLSFSYTKTSSTSLPISDWLLQYVPPRMPALTSLRLVDAVTPGVLAQAASPLSSFLVAGRRRRRRRDTENSRARERERLVRLEARARERQREQEREARQEDRDEEQEEAQEDEREEGRGRREVARRRDEATWPEGDRRAERSPQGASADRAREAERSGAAEARREEGHDRADGGARRRLEEGRAPQRAVDDAVAEGDGETRGVRSEAPRNVAAAEEEAAAFARRRQGEDEQEELRARGVYPVTRGTHRLRLDRVPPLVSPAALGFLRPLSGFRGLLASPARARAERIHEDVRRVRPRSFGGLRRVPRVPLPVRFALGVFPLGLSSLCASPSSFASPSLCFSPSTFSPCTGRSTLKLRKLCLEAADISDLGLQAIAAALGREAETLSLKRCASLSEAGHGAIADHCPNLTSLNLGFCSGVNDLSVCSLLSCCPMLRTLVLNDARISDVALEAIGKCLGENLFELALHRSDRITNEGLKALAKFCPNLALLSLSACPQITDAGVIHIALSCRKLLKLRLDGTRVTDLAIRAVAQNLHRLRYLHLQRCGSVSGDSLRCFSAETHPCLKCIELSDPHRKISKEEICAFRGRNRPATALLLGDAAGDE